jgi:hypothetical protein
LLAVKARMAGSSPAMTTEILSAIAQADHGAIDTGEKSTNQLFGGTNPLIFAD